MSYHSRMGIQIVLRIGLLSFALLPLGAFGSPSAYNTHNSDGPNAPPPFDDPFEKVDRAEMAHPKNANIIILPQSRLVPADPVPAPKQTWAKNIPAKPLMKIDENELPPIAVQEYENLIASLISPAKLSTLNRWDSDSQLQKAIVYLELARRAGLPITEVVSNAVFTAGYRQEVLTSMTSASLLRGHKLSTALDVFTEEGILAMRHGRPPTITKGLYQGDTLIVVPIVSATFAPELDNMIANLEFMPAKVSSERIEKIGEREIYFLKRFRAMGRITTERFDTILKKNGISAPIF